MYPSHRRPSAYCLYCIHPWGFLCTLPRLSMWLGALLRETIKILFMTTFLLMINEACVPNSSDFESRICMFRHQSKETAVIIQWATPIL